MAHLLIKYAYKNNLNNSDLAPWAIVLRTIAQGTATQGTDFSAFQLLFATLKLAN
jgi:hypothetical protein